MTYGCPPVPLLTNKTEIVQQPVVLQELTARYAAEAVQRIEGWGGSDAPFALYVAFDHPHSPQFASDARRGTSLKGTYGDSIEELDAAVGRVMDAVRTLDERSTLVLFTYDNGAPASSYAAGSNQPFSGSK